jgi:hypothetical protein
MAFLATCMAAATIILLAWCFELAIRVARGPDRICDAIDRQTAAIQAAAQDTLTVRVVFRYIPIGETDR